MEGEPSWTKQISSEQVCTFFYAFAIVNAVIGLLGLGLGLWSIFVTKMPVSFVTPMLIQIVITSGLAFTSALFQFLICERALLNKQ